MQDSKLVKMFKALSTEECKYLRWFAQSNFFNTDPNLLRLYEALAKHYPDFISKAMTKEALFGKVFAGQAFNDGKWRNLCSKMIKLLEQYYVWLELEHQETTKQKLLTAAYGRRNLFEQFEKSTNELSKNLEKKSELSADALRERMLVNLQYYRHPKTSKFDNLHRLQAAMDDLDYYYFAEKLWLACDLKVIENMVVGAAPIRLKSEIESILAQSDGRKLVYLENYAQVLSLLEKNASMEAFQLAFDFFSGISENLSEEDRQFGLLHLLNYAINQVNKGKAEYRSIIMDLYKLGLRQGVLINNGSISSSTFINIASHGSALLEFEWTENFINSYMHLLDRSVCEEAKTICLGFLNFYRKDYSAAIGLLINFTFEDFNTNLMAKSLLIRSYFGLFESDTSYYPLFISYHKSLDKFIRRERMLSGNKKLWHLNFGGELAKLARIKYQGKLDESTKTKLQNDIMSKEMILKKWLLDTLSEIKK